MEGMDDASIPSITVGRFGLEQRCAYRHPDLYDEEVPEMDLETALSRPDLGAGCAVRTFLLLGDQNAGKSTMLHSFCRDGDPSFMQLSSLLPILSASFLNTRLVPTRLLTGDVNQAISVVRDELPFMDTDIARGVVMLTLENFAFFCNEFGLMGTNGGLEGGDGERSLPPVLQDVHQDTRFIALQFVELGGDHLDRLLRFSAAGGDLAMVRLAEGCEAPGEDETFWTDMHEVLLGSLRLLEDTTRTVYFINCAVLFLGSHLNSSPLRSMLRKLRFLNNALGSRGSSSPGATCEVLFYCSRVAAVDASGFNPAVAWAAARSEVLSFLRDELGAIASGVAARGLPVEPPPEVACWESVDEGLDLSPLEDVAGAAAHEWRIAEERASPLLAFIREMLTGLVLPALRTRLQFAGVYAVRNLAEAPEASSCHGALCVPSIVRNVARLLQRQLCHMDAKPGGMDASLVPHVSELILRSAVGLRRVEPPAAPGAVALIMGRWVTRSDLADHLEECEVQNTTVPLPELATLQGWDAAASALVDSGVCTELAPGGAGLPMITLELTAGSPAAGAVVRIRPDSAVAAQNGGASKPDDVLFVIGGKATQSKAACRDAVGLPLDGGLFELLTSEAAIGSVAAHAGQRVGGRFRFSAPESKARLAATHLRLRREMDELFAQALDATSPALSADFVGQLLHKASDTWQAGVLLESGEAGSVRGNVVDATSREERAAKRACTGGAGVALQRVAERLQAAAAAAPELNVLVDFVGEEGGSAWPAVATVELRGPLLRLPLGLC